MKKKAHDTLEKLYELKNEFLSSSDYDSSFSDE